MFLFFKVSIALNCEIGVIKIDHGKWVNKDSIYNKIDICYSGDSLKIRELKQRYNNSAEDDMRYYQQTDDKYSIELPRVIKILKQLDITSDIIGYFPSHHESSQILIDSLNLICNLRDFEISKLDAWQKQKYEEVLEKIVDRIFEYKMYTKLINTPIPIIDHDSLHLPNFIIPSLRGLSDTMINRPGQYLFAFSYFIKLGKGAKNYDKLLQKANENELLRCLASVQINVIGNKYFDTNAIVADTLLKLIHYICGVSSGTKEIIYNIPWVFSNIASPIVNELDAYYRKLVILQTNEASQNNGIDKFNRMFPKKEIIPILKDIEKFGINVKNYKSTVYDIISQSYAKMKRIIQQKKSSD